MPKWAVSTKDFRKTAPKLVRTRDGWKWISECEELIGGRWEGFISDRSITYKTKAEALWHKPRRK